MKFSYRFFEKQANGKNNRLRADSNLFIVIIAIQSNETPTLPYCKNGIKRHRNSPCVHVPWIKRNALNGKTIIQNRQSATHKLCKRKSNEMKI